MPVDFGRKVHCLLGLPFDAVDMPTTVARIRSAAAGGPPCFLSTPNLNFLIACQDDADFRASVINCDLSIADGMPLVWIARLLGLPIRERVAGSSVFAALRGHAERPLSVYFFGGLPGVAEQAAARLNFEARGLRCVGFECPGFGSVEEMSSTATLDRINASGANFVVVALGARKGQAWIERNRERIAAPVISHLGAVVNFVAGTVSRAPAWMQKSGMEWLWRIKEEPGLWHRYLRDGLALARLLATRVLPHALYLLRHRPAPGSKSDAEIEVSQHDGTPMLCLNGAWGNDQLDPLRREFTAAVAAGGEVWLDMKRVSYIDSAFVGLVLLLFGWQSQSGRQLLIVATSPAVRRVFRFCCAEFVLDAGSSPAKLMDRLVHQHT